MIKWFRQYRVDANGLPGLEEDIDDDELPGLKKKESGGGIGSVFGLNAGVSNGQSQERDFSKIVDRLPRVSVEDNDPIGTVNSYVNNKSVEAEHKLANLKPGENPFDIIAEQRNWNKSLKAFNQLTIPNGSVAKDIVQRYADKTLKSSPTAPISTNVDDISIDELRKIVPQNQTGKIALQKYEHKRDVDKAISEGGTIWSMAGKAFKAPLDNSGDAKNGKDVQAFFDDPDVQERAKNDPAFAMKLREAKSNFYDTYKGYAISKTRTDLAQKLEDEKMTGWLYANPGVSKTDKAAEMLVKEGTWGPKEMEIYKHTSRPIIEAGGADQILPSTDFMHNFGYGVYNATEGLNKSGWDLTHKALGGWGNNPDVLQSLGITNSTEDVDEAFKKEQENRLNVLGSNAFRRGVAQSGQFTGFATPLILGNALGISEIPMGVMMFEGQNAEKARSLFKDDPGKQNLYTLLSTTFDAAFAKALPTKQPVSSLKNAFESDIISTINKLSNKSITESEAKTLLSDKLQNALSSVAKSNTKTAALLNAYELGHNGLDAAFGKRDFNVLKEAGDQANNFITNWFASTPLSLMGIRGIKNNRIESQMLLNIAERPEIFIDKINELAKQHPEFQKEFQEKLNNVNYLEAVNRMLDKRNLTPEQRADYLRLSLKQKLKSEEINKNPDEVLAAQDKKEVELAKIEQERILNPEITNTEHLEKLYKNGLLEKGFSRMLENEDGKFDPTKVGEFLKFVAQQANGLDENWQPLKGKVPEINLPKSIIDIANDRWEDEINNSKTNQNEPTTSNEEMGILKGGQENGQETGSEGGVEGRPETRPEGGQENNDTGKQEKVGVSVIMPETKEQLPTVEIKPKNEATEENTESDKPEQAEKEPFVEEEPTKDNEGADELPFGRQGTTGIAHGIQVVRAYDINAGQPERGEGVTVEEAIKHGQELLSKGEDPNKAAEDFKKDKKISFDALSLVRAKHEELVRATNKAVDDFGEESKEAKEAQKAETDWYDKIVKPMQTEWSKIGMAQQGHVDIDTGSFAGIRRAFEQETGKPMNERQSKTAKELSSKVKTLEKEVEDLKAKLTEAIDKGETTDTDKESKNIKKSAKELANKIREKAKLHRPGSFSAATPASAVWDTAVEIVAKTIEVGGTVAHAIKRGLDHVKESDWYKSLSKDEKEKAVEDFTNFHISQEETNIFTRIANKKPGTKFTTDEVKALWDYSKKEYLDKGASFDEMINKTATDFGIKPEQVRDAITQPKGAKKISDAMYKKQNDRNMAVQRAKDWVKASNVSPLVKFLRSIPRFFFAAKVFGHGTVGMVTHSGINVYDPVEWKRYWPVFFKQFKFAYGKQADYERAMQDLQNDPSFIFWKRNGLAVDPRERYDDYQFITKIFERMGKVGRWLTAGDRGFNALKVYRLERAKALWKDLSASEKADPETPKRIAKLVNHSTGTTNLKVSEVAQTAFFAPNLELARWNKLITDPARAVKTFSNWKNATPAEQAEAKVVGKRAVRILATYMGALTVNQGLLLLSGSNQRINFTDPTSSDWLKFKAGGRTIDLTGGMISLLGFLVRLGKLAGTTDAKRDADLQEEGKYISGKLSPFASTVNDLRKHHDFRGNTLPFFNDKPLHSWNKKLTLGEYLKQQQTPIPVAEYFTDMQKQLEDEGMTKPKALDVIKSLFVAGMVGGTGVHIGEEPREQTKYISQEDKSNPVFKKVTKDWDMKLPEVSASSEIITDEDKGTKKRLADYPKEEQEKYMKVHKNFLQEELQNIFDNGTVYVKEYKDAGGEEKNEVSINEPIGDYKEKKLEDLTKNEKAQVLSIAQKQATKRAKKEVFGNE